MAINVGVQHNGGFLPGIILLIQCYYHRGTRLNAIRFLYYLQPMVPPKRFDISPPDWGMLRRSRCVQIFLQTFTVIVVVLLTVNLLGYTLLLLILFTLN